MLRSYAYSSKHDELAQVIEQFAIKMPNNIAIERFESLTPDSFLWKLSLDDVVYYLYAEDYVPGLAYIKKTFAELIPSSDWQLIKAKRAKTFETSSPVARASVYKKADDADDMMPYTIPSGHDFVFLAKTKEKP
ncbi:MAG: hypothetical protein KIH63_005670 [Candidatus Saccharibacteria bacterium]|nr:hypothetical protein [Candidatus Saccharibacteria bacterium]